MSRNEIEKKIFKQMIKEMINKWLESDQIEIQKELAHRVRVFEDEEAKSKQNSKGKQRAKEKLQRLPPGVSRVRS